MSISYDISSLPRMREKMKIRFNDHNVFDLGISTLLRMRWKKKIRIRIQCL